MAIAVKIGHVKETRAKVRHGIKVFKKKHKKVPSVALMNERETKTPRVEGSLEIYFSLVFVTLNGNFRVSPYFAKVPE